MLGDVTRSPELDFTDKETEARGRELEGLGAQVCRQTGSDSKSVTFRSPLLTGLAPPAHHKDTVLTGGARLDGHVLHDSISTTCWKRRNNRDRKQIRVGWGRG